MNRCNAAARRAHGPAATLRRACGWTQAQAARRLGLCTRTLQRIEATAPTWPEAEQLARVYGAALGRRVNPQYELYGLPAPHAGNAGHRAGLSTRAAR